ncbi:uncharacterized protein LOC144644704 [Oculina patagonica]
MMRLTIFIFSVVLITGISVSDALFVSWDKNANLTKDDIFIGLKRIYVPNKFGKITQEFRNLTTHSLDERCQKGMPLSISWSLNEPYSLVMGPKIGRKLGFAARGIFPSVVQRLVHYCCNGSEIVYGTFMKSNREAEEHFSEQMYDFTFPVYQSKLDKNLYRDQPFVSVVAAPRVVLLVYDGTGKKTRTQNLADTIFNAWPFLIFILAAAGASGMIVWLLEYVFFSKEFPRKFVNGAWDGFWWAVVTMTTVGYGDSSPKSLPGRLFCFIWIITGINIISIFTALVTATVTASTRPYFNVHGAKIGAVNGSEEFRLGVSINFDMQAFGTPASMTQAVKYQEVDGILIDNYALTRFSNRMAKEPFRVERTIEHPITYGLVLPSGSPNTEQCVRRYMKNFNHEIFERIAKHLKPIKSESTDKNYAVKATEGLFYQEHMFSTIVRIGVITVASLVLIGLMWEFAYRRRRYAKSLSTKAATEETQEMIALQSSETDSKTSKKEELVLGYNKFHQRWIEQLFNTKLQKP